MKTWIKYTLIILSVLIVMSGVIIWQLYNTLYTPVSTDKDCVIYITEDDTIDSIVYKINKLDYNINDKLFEQFAELKSFSPSTKPGRYNIANLSINQIVNKLRLGSQDAINYTFISTRDIKDIISSASNSFYKVDSLELTTLLSDKQYLKSLGFNDKTIPAMFIPNTYKMYWTTTSTAFLEKMNREFNSFWNKERVAKAQKLNLTPVQVATLASIIDEESSYIPEYKRIAGVYLNRLKIGMKLEADPTLKFANGDFSTKRVLDKDKLIDSPYNTYMYAGLPPGPIRVPSVQAIDAVLNAENHNFMFFCANSDFSGTHVFAKNLREHNNNANKYRKALQQRKIYR